jgi:hypothetical protein
MYKAVVYLPTLLGVQIGYRLYPNSQIFVVCFLLGTSPASEFQKPGNYPKENIQYTEHGEILKSRIANFRPRPQIILTLVL